MGSFLTGIVVVVVVVGIVVAWTQQKKKALGVVSEVEPELATRVDPEVETHQTELSEARPKPAILLADDSITIHKVVELLLVGTDCDLVVASNGPQAFSYLAEYCFDVVITDVHMPGKNGYEVCEYSKSLDPTVPVILLVGFFEPFDEKAYGRCGADDIVKKPFDSQDLLSKVEEAVAERDRSD